MLGQGDPTAPREKAVGLEPPFHATVLGLEVTKLEQMVQEGLGCRVKTKRQCADSREGPLELTLPQGCPDCRS